MSTNMQVDKTKLLTNTFYNSFAQVFSLISVFLFTPLLLREFGRLQFGLYTLSSSIVASLALLDFGIGQSLTVQIARDDALSARFEMRQKIKSAYLIYTVIGILVALTLVVLGIFSEQLFKVTTYEGLSLSTLLYVNAVIQLFFWPLQSARHVLAGLKDFKSSSLSTLLTLVLVMLAMIVTLLMGRGPVVLSALAGVALLIGQLRNSLVLRAKLNTQVGESAAAKSASDEANVSAESELSVLSDDNATQAKVSDTFQWALIRSLVMASLPLFVIQVSGSLMREQTDRLVLGVMLGAVAVAVYELGAKFSLMFSQLLSLGISAVLPVVSNLEAQKDEARIRQLYVRGSRYLALLLIPIGVLLILMADTILIAWLGNPEPEAALILRLLIGAQIFLPLYALSDSILIAQKRFGFWIKIAIAISLLNLLASIILVKNFGIAGAAAGTLLANLIEFPIFSGYILKTIGLKAGEWLKSTLIPAVATLVLPFAIASALKATLTASALINLLLISALFLSNYWLLTYAIVLKDWEKAQLRGFIEKYLK